MKESIRANSKRQSKAGRQDSRFHQPILSIFQFSRTKTNLLGKLYKRFNHRVSNNPKTTTICQTLQSHNQTKAFNSDGHDRPKIKEKNQSRRQGETTQFPEKQRRIDNAKQIKPYIEDETFVGRFPGQATSEVYAPNQYQNRANDSKRVCNKRERQCFNLESHICSPWSLSS